MPLGAGACPAGAVPAGYGQIDVAPAPVLVPLPDVRTGLPDGGRNISLSGTPGTLGGAGDYTFTADGRLQGMPNVNQLVLLAVENVDLSSITEKGPQFANQVRALVQASMFYVVTAKLARIDSIVVLDRQPNQNPDGVVAILNWTDLTTGLQGEPVPITP